jgi:RNA polymerase sigma factor (sigma-70 family)
MNPPALGAGSASISSLVREARCGDHQAWDELVHRYSPLLTGVCFRLRLSTAETEDVAQAVWLRLVEHIAEIREPGGLPAWLATTARREGFRLMAARRRTVPHDPTDSKWLSDVTHENPDEELIRSERRDALLSGFAELPLRQRMLLQLLSEDPPLTYAEISARTGIPIGSIGPTRARALERLRRTEPIRRHLLDISRGPVSSRKNVAHALQHPAPPEANAASPETGDR